MTRARTDIDAIRRDVTADFIFFRQHCTAIDESRWANLETFAAVALRVMSKTNPSKIRDAAIVEEISAWNEGRILKP